MTAEEFIKDYTYGCSNELVGWSDGKEVVVYHEWLTPSQALCAVELKKEEMIEKAWDWIDDNLLSPNQQDNSRLYFERFKNYMKGE